MSEPDLETDRWFYGLLAEEARFQVSHGWSYTQFFVLLNAGLVGAVLAFLSAGGARAIAVAALVLGACMAAVGVLVLRENKRYYRVLALRRAALERRLGLDAVLPGSEDPIVIRSLSATSDAAKIDAMLRAPRDYVRPRLRRGSVSDWARFTLLGLALLEVTMGILLAVGIL